MVNDEKINKENIDNIISLSAIQEGMLFHYLIEDNRAIYQNQFVMTVSGDMHEDTFCKAWKFVAASNEALRTVFKWQNLNSPVQIILKELQIPICFIDLSNLNESQAKDAVKILKETDKNEKIRIDKNPFRIMVCKLKGKKSEIVISNHHIIYDGWSNGILIKEFFEAYDCYYQNKQPIVKQKTRYKDYINYINRLNKKSQESFWRSYLESYTIPAALRSNKEHKLIREKSFGSCEYQIQESLMDSVQRYATKMNVTPVAVLNTAWGVAAGLANNTQEIVFGTTISGRTAEILGIDEMVGLFINTLPLRVGFSEENLSDCVQTVASHLNERVEYENTPLTDVLLYSGLDKNEEIFDSIMVVENYPIPHIQNESLIFEDYYIDEYTNYNLVFVLQGTTELKVKMVFNTIVYDEDTIEKLFNSFKQILSSIISEKMDKSHKQIFSVPQLRDRELTQSYKQVHRLFEEQVLKTPDKTAIIFEDTNITYDELNKKANQLARKIQINAPKNQIVGLFVTHSIETVIGILAVIKAGCAYLPIDPEYPEKRIEYMLFDSSTEVVLINCENNKKIPDDIVAININDPDLYTGQADNLSDTTMERSPVYVIYTSGSSGKPKGVLIEHHSLVNYILWSIETYIRNREHTFALYSSLSFDLTVTSIFVPLLSGNKIIIYENTSDEYVLYRILRDNKSTIIKLTPSHLCLLKDVDCSKSSVSLLIIGGEKLETDLAKQIYDNFDGRIEMYNEYGPTEATVGCMIHKYSENDDSLLSVPIGKSIRNTDIYVLDDKLCQVAVGGVGEIYIAGDCLARGYLNNQQLTKEKFVLNPFRNDSIMYQTGDLAKVRKDMSLKYLGRTNSQVKIRGFRVEIGEIKSEILDSSQIDNVEVLLRKNGNIEYLCAYYISKNIVDVNSLKKDLKTKLPEYMIPLQFIKVPFFPLTINGKIDINQLIKADADIDHSVESKLSEDKITLQIAEIWRNVLGIQNINFHSNFFNLGGNSILLIRLHSQIDKLYPGKMKIVDFFAHSTISQIAEFLKRDHYENKKIPLNIEAVKFPSDYFTQSQDFSEYVYRYTLEENTLQSLKNISEIQELRPVEVLLAIFFYLLIVVTKQKEITVQTMLVNPDEVIPIKLFTENITDIQMIYEAIKRNMDHNDFYMFRINDVLITRNGGLNSIIPFVYDSNLMETQARFNEIYNVTLKLDIQENKADFTIEYQEQYIKKEKFDEFVLGYIHLIKMITNS